VPERTHPPSNFDWAAALNNSMASCDTVALAAARSLTTDARGAAPGLFFTSAGAVVCYAAAVGVVAAASSHCYRSLSPEVGIYHWDLTHG
jgi:hypothetical protein